MKKIAKIEENSYNILPVYLEIQTTNRYETRTLKKKKNHTIDTDLGIRGSPTEALDYFSTMQFLCYKRRDFCV